MSGPALIRGTLISSAFAADVLPTLPLFAIPAADTRRAMASTGEQLETELGPASSPRQVAEVVVLPLLRVLGLTVTAREDDPRAGRLSTVAGGAAGPLVLVTAWGESLAPVWRLAVHAAIAGDVRWCLCCNGSTLRAIDARHTWSRAHVEFDLGLALRDAEGQALLWTLLRADALAGVPPALAEAAARSAQHGVTVCQELAGGVREALGRLLSALGGRRPAPADVRFDHSLTVLYRVLFLLFAEARGLVPVWHPLYRERYSVDTIVTALLAGRRWPGLWHSIKAIGRLAHAGCRAGELKVNAFNGRLFSPVSAASFDDRPLPDAVMRDAIVAVSSVPGSRGRVRIAYRDLDVEQLGAVYEQVLDYAPAANPGLSPRAADPDGTRARRTPLVRTRDLRKATGTFYTPRGLTSYLVQRTLAPLVENRSSEAILRLRIVDPAMGSGAFLVAACRFLAAAAEEALIAEGRWHPQDVTAADRAALRRDIAARCLYGIDLNPMAVHLAHLSLWLATLAADKPLSFLDHHLVVGDSLLGAAPGDVQRQPGGGHTRSRRVQPLPLFAHTGLEEALADAAAVRLELAAQPDDTAAAVRRKERTLAGLTGGDTAVTRWAHVLDLWCAAWFWSDGTTLGRGIFSALVQQLLHDRAVLPGHVGAPLLEHAAQVAAAHRFLHWPLLFPEVFADGGFDAVIGNPPWDMVRGDSGVGETRGARRRLARDANAFFRGAGIYRVDSRAHANRYQLFVERALQVVRPAGRIGLVLPAGVVSDTGSGALRRFLFDRAAIDAITGMDNRRAIFPIHRSVRFALVTATAGRPTTRIACRFGLSRVEELRSPQAPLILSRDLLGRLSGPDDLGIPELRTERDLQVVEGIDARVPRLGQHDGWNVQFGRELNASDDRHAFAAVTGGPAARPVIEGRQLTPFRVDVSRSRFELRATTGVGRRIPRRVRLAYRDVASATNRLTLIAALLPAHVVSTHTVFCLKTPLPPARQEVLCALLNSFVANYLIRLRVSTHVTVGLVCRLPVPVVAAADPACARLQRLAQGLSRCEDVEQDARYAEVQAIAARLYGLSAADFSQVLSTFPLIPEPVRRAAYEYFCANDT